MPVSDFEFIISEHGEPVVHQEIKKVYDPEYGHEIDRVVTSTSSRAYIEELRIEDKLFFPGELRKIDVRGYFRPKDSLKPGDYIIRYPGISGKEISYEVESVREYSNYIESDLKRRE